MNILEKIFPRTKIFLVDKDDIREVVGPPELLQSIGGYFGHIIIGSDLTEMNGTIVIGTKKLEIGDNNINGILFSDLKFKDE